MQHYLIAHHHSILVSNLFFELKKYVYTHVCVSISLIINVIPYTKMKIL